MRHRKRAVRTILAAAMLAGCGDETNDATSPEAPRVSLAIVSGDEQSGEAGTVLPDPLVVRLTDAGGTPASGATVRFSPGPGMRDSLVVTDRDGIASLTWTLRTSAGTQDVPVSARLHDGPTGKAVTSFVLTVLPGAPARISVGFPDDVVAAATAALDTVTVNVSDRFGNGVPSEPVTWSVTMGGGSVVPTDERTDAGGIARALWTLGSEPGENRLQVTSGAVTRALAATGTAPLIATSVVVGARHACALAASGAAFCWGSNDVGQLATGFSGVIPYRIPIAAAGQMTFVALAAGALHTCGLTAQGDVFCWGSNSAGQTAASALGYQPSAKRVMGLPPMRAITAGDFHTCGLSADGAAYCWGDDSVGQLGAGFPRSDPVRLGGRPRPDPSPVAGIHRFVAIAATDFATCGTTADALTLCWGANNFGELGSPVVRTCDLLEDSWYYDVYSYSWLCSTSPIPIASDARVTSLARGDRGLCATTIDDGLLCWGTNGSMTPRRVSGADVSRAWVILNHVCGAGETGGLRCWTLADGFPAAEPITGSLPLEGFDSRDANACGLRGPTPAAVYCWGDNANGQVGDGTLLRRASPVPVSSPRPDTRRVQ